MERGRYRIRLRIILAALVFSPVIFLSGCGGGGGGGGNGPPPPPPTASICNQNNQTNVYNCNINITINNTAGYSQSGGASVTVANPK